MFNKKPDANDSCPFCEEGDVHPFPDETECVLNKPIFMVIPPQGVHLPCPAHPKGHHVYGPRIRDGL